MAVGWRYLLACYARGVFPMADGREADDVYLVDPPVRGILPIERFHIPRRLARTVRADPFEIRADTAFEAVLDACAAPRAGAEDSWINGPIRSLYLDLHRAGHAHSLECWKGGALAGGLYGVRLGGAFFGESMVSMARDASKVALVHLVARLRSGGYRLLDAQFHNDHLAQFGLIEIERADYHARLAEALVAPADPAALSRPLTGAQSLQATTQAS